MRILGICPSHDSSVCVINDGKIEFFAKEERLSGVKRDMHAKKCLDLVHSVYGSNAIDYATYSWQQFEDGRRFLMTEENVRRKFGLTLKEPRPFSKNNYFQHHLNHAAVAFYNSGFEEALTFVIDRNGTEMHVDFQTQYREAESVFHCKYPNNFITLQKNFWTSRKLDPIPTEILEYVNHLDIEYDLSHCFSIVKVYEAATTMINQDALENGKTMGLSSYGEDKNYESLFDGNFKPIDSMFEEIIFEKNPGMPTSCFKGQEEYITKEVTRENYQLYANWAKQVQLETQHAALNLIQKHVEKTGIKNVCISGGYGLNIVANAFYIKNLPDVNFYFEPLSDDTGNSIGCAMNLYRQLTNDDTIYTPKNNFYHYYEDTNLETEKHHLVENVGVEELSEILINQNIISIFEGAPESGPRALGHRSILFDPRVKNGKDIVNTLKKREWYRPFAGIILEEYFQDYFDTMNLEKSEYMTINFNCKKNVKDYIPSIVHVDNTCRIQTVNKDNLFLYQLLTSFYNKTGCPILLNTSFNLAGKPLIQTKKQALDFMEELDISVPFSGVYFVDDKKLISIKKGLKHFFMKTESK
jgi:carbamoyltransferase